MNQETEHNVTSLLAERTISRSRETLDRIENILDTSSTDELERVIKTVEIACVELSKLT